MRYKNLILFVLLSIAWGSAFNAIKIGLNYFPPVLFASLRYILAGAIMITYATLVTQRILPKNYNEFLQILVAGFFMITVYHTLLFIGELRVESGIASIIVSMSPVLTTGFARVILPKERLDKVGLIGLGVGFLGILLLLSPSSGDIFSIDLFRIMILLAAASFAIGSVLTRFLDSDLEIEAMEAWSMIIGALFMLVISYSINEPLLSINISINALLALSYLALFSSSIGFLIYFNLLQDLGPIEVNLVSYSAPIVATIIGILFLDEEIRIISGIALLMIFLGFFLLKRDQIKREIEKISL
ncbi:EamA family transporter [archaeon SCG-AAA382B04]|nr:EamA family transporter [archaeon SCG-AAA382B04]